MKPTALVSSRWGRLGLLFLAMSCLGVPAKVLAESGGDPFVLGCGDYRHVSIGRIDYRLRESSADVARGVRNLENFHVRLSRQEMEKLKPRAQTVVGNLDFALRYCPNHHEALRMFIQWELAGGNLRQLPRSACYLEWAIRFAPDDGNVLLYGGNYFWKSGDNQRAKAWYEKALELNPGAADVHYNLGLLSIELQEFETAREHARAAYSLGFPLPGLRDKLRSAGYPITMNSSGESTRQQ